MSYFSESVPYDQHIIILHVETIIQNFILNSFRFGNEEARKREAMAAREEAKKIKAAEDAANAKKAMQKVKHTQASIGKAYANSGENLNLRGHLGVPDTVSGPLIVPLNYLVILH